MAFPPEWIEKVRDKIKTDPLFLRKAVLRFDQEWFHVQWTRFSAANPFHLIEAPRGFGKTKNNTVGDAIEEIARDPNTRILIVSKTETQARRPLAEIRAHLETNEILKACFGEFVGTGKWTETELTVAQRTEPLPEATVTAIGLEGPIIGGHWNHIFFDDVFDEESSRTIQQRDRAYEWLFTTLMPTLLPGGTMRGRCTRYHYEDLAGRIERDLATEDGPDGEKVARVFHVEDIRDGAAVMPAGVQWAILKASAIQRDGTSLWESRVPLEDRTDENGRLTKGLTRLRREMGARRFGQQYQMDCPRESAGARETIFKARWRKLWLPKQLPSVIAEKHLPCFMHIDPAWKSETDAKKIAKRQKEPDKFAVGALFYDKDDDVSYVVVGASKHLAWAEGIAFARDLVVIWKPRQCSIEKTGLQQSAAPEFYRTVRSQLPCPTVWAYPNTDKIEHATPFAVANENGRVWYDPELVELFEEEDAFPYGQFDDLVDAESGAYLLATKRHPVRLARYLEQRVPGEAAAGGLTEGRYSAIPGSTPTLRAGGRGSAPGGAGPGGASRRSLPPPGWR